MKIVEGLQSLVAPLTELKPASNNPRVGDVEAIVKSYERFGQRKPIVVSRETSEIIAGNHQYQAALKLGWEGIAVVWVDDDEETATAYSVADNRIGQLGEWNVEELVAAFDVMDPDDYEAAGFQEIDIEDYRALLDEQVATTQAVVTEGGLTGADPEDKVKRDKSYAEFLEQYASKATRAVILYYQNDTYAKMVDGLQALAEKYGLSDHADVVERLVNDATS